MANFFLDNQDIQFQFEHLDLKELARLQEYFAENGDADYAPVDEADVRPWRPMRRTWTTRATR